MVQLAYGSIRKWERETTYRFVRLIFLFEM